jgi:hypothetical protein
MLMYEYNKLHSEPLEYEFSALLEHSIAYALIA